METQDINNAKEEPKKLDKKRTRISQSDVPVYALDDALRVPRAIIENYGGQSATPLQVASAVNMTPSSGSFRMLCGSAIAYGLTDGGYNAKEILVEQLAKRILTPLEEEDDLAAKREASLKPRVIGDFIRKYDRSPLPRTDIAINVLVDMGVPQDRADSVYKMILETAEYVEIIQEIKNKQYIELSGVYVASKIDKDEAAPIIEEVSTETKKLPMPKIPYDQTGKKELGQGIFIAHGKNKKPLEQLKRILDQFKIPYKIAIDEPNLGRPIGAKVKETMETCNCAILIFTADEEFFNKEGTSIWRPSENVVYELGASSYLYGNRIVILKEEGVEFPSNFNDLGYISFAKDQLETKSVDVLKELIGFGIVKIYT